MKKLSLFFALILISAMSFGQITAPRGLKVIKTGGATVTLSGDEISALDNATGNIQEQLNDTVSALDYLAPKSITVNAQTGTSYTLVLSDAYKVVTMTNASANTLTIPLNSVVAFPVGTQITIVQGGAGETTIAITSGGTLNSVGSYKDLRVQWSTCTLIKLATDTWLIIGDIEA